MILNRHRRERGTISGIVVPAVFECLPMLLALSVAFSASATPKTFPARGFITAIQPDQSMLVINHQAISNYMDAMTMPFRVRQRDELKGLQPGDEITFRLQVTDTESWIDSIAKTGIRKPEVARAPRAPSAVSPAAPARRNPLLDFKFTNELGQPVALADFHGQALAITFFFTRCPVPDFCPRLSRNFEEASEKLRAMPGAPQNWHFLSFSFDTVNDTPPVLKAYAERYHYDPARWSFLTGPQEQINELARASGVQVDPEAGLFNHNFRTMVVDANGHLQTTFPFGGDLSDALVAEILKACKVSPKPAPVGPGASSAR